MVDPRLPLHLPPGCFRSPDSSATVLQLADHSLLRSDRQQSAKVIKVIFVMQVLEGMQGTDHGVVICKLCQRHNKTNNFAGEGYR